MAMSVSWKFDDVLWTIGRNVGLVSRLRLVDCELRSSCVAAVQSRLLKLSVWPPHSEGAAAYGAEYCCWSQHHVGGGM